MSKSKKNVVVVSGSNKNITGKVVKKKVIKRPAETEVETKGQVVDVKPDKQPSKMDLATRYLEDNPGLSRKEIIKHFRDVIGLTPAGSATYVQLIFRRLNYKATKRDSKAAS